MVLKNIFCGIALWMSAIGYLTAQTIRVDTTNQFKGTNEVVVFSKDASRSDSPRPGHDNNVVKIGLIYFVSGNIPVYYERKILPWLSVQGGIGLTTRDFVADVVNIIFQNGQPEYSPYYQYSERRALVGVYASVQPKFYVHNDALDGFWLSPMLEFKRYNFKANMVDETQTNNDGTPVYLTNIYQHEHRNALDFTFNLGWQWLFNPLMVEFSMGAGFRRFWEERIDIEAGTTNPITGYQYYTNGVRYYNGFRPECNMSLNFGGFF